MKTAGASVQTTLEEKYQTKQVGVVKLDREEAGELYFKTETVLASSLDESVLCMSVDRLKSELHDNGQVQVGDHLVLVLRVLFGRTFGRMAKCDLCGSFLDWSSQTASFVCRGYNYQRPHRTEALRYLAQFQCASCWSI